MFNEKNDSTVNWKQIEAERLEMAGYTEAEILAIQTSDTLEKYILEFYSKQYINVITTYKKKHNDLLNKGDM